MPGRTSAEIKECKEFVKANSKALSALLDREVKQGAADPALADSVAKFLSAHQKKWYWPF